MYNAMYNMRMLTLTGLGTRLIEPVVIVSCSPLNRLLISYEGPLSKTVCINIVRACLFEESI